MTGITLFSLPALFNAALLYTTSVLQYILLPQTRQKSDEIDRYTDIQSPQVPKVYEILSE
jgi:hypothetical protein